MSTFFGRLHLLLLHLPIGILLLSAGLALWSQWKKTTLYRQAIEHAVRLGAIAAVVAAACGWVLANQGDYDPDTLQWHRWTGVLGALLAIAAWWVQYTRWYFLMIYATTLVIAVAGHFGGTITHGEDFLFQTTANTESVAAVDPQQPAFEAVILPIFKQKCVSCHNPNKRKGGLMLDTWEHLLAGGENGKVLVPGSTDSSELYKRMLLPAHDEKRMPPKGKIQLTDEEIAMIGRWIKAGAQREMPASAILPETKAVDFPNVKVSPASDADLKQLRDQLISVTRLSNDLPWLSVSLAGKNDLSNNTFDLLKKVSDQIVHLDASHSNLTDEMMAEIAGLKHLTRLHLSGTRITSAGLAKIAGMAHLRFLNITGTAVDDTAVETIGRLPALQSVYLLGSGITPAAMDRLRQQHPALVIGQAPPQDSAAAPLQLMPPKMWYIRTVFDDTVQVKLDFPFKNVAMYYTLDQASPTTQSFQYKGEPIVLSESGVVRAVAIKQGWEPSPVIEASFAKIKYKPVDIRLVGNPSPKYPAQGAETLSDQLLGTDANDGRFLGYQGEHLTAILDFGKNIDITSVSVHYLENNAPWIFAPKGVQVWASTDGRQWAACAQQTAPVNPSMQPAKVGILQARLTTPQAARYLKVKVENLVTLPKWHPSAGQKSWVFVDEIMVE